MKLIIDIPKERLDSIKHFGIKQNEVSMLERAIVNGTLLDDVKAAIKKYEADCSFSTDRDECRLCDKIVFNSIYNIIDRALKED